MTDVQDRPVIDIRAKRAATSISALQAKRKQRLADRPNRSDKSLDRGLVRLGVTNTNVLTGEDDLSEWDDEELKRGQKRDRNGNFSGRPPVVVPRVLHNELVKRTLQKSEELMRDNLYAAVEALTEIATDSDVPAKDRVSAIKLIMDRVMGRESIRVEVTEKKRWEIALEGSIVSLESVPEMQVLDLSDSALHDPDDEPRD